LTVLEQKKQQNDQNQGQSKGQLVAEVVQTLVRRRRESGRTLANKTADRSTQPSLYRPSSSVCQFDRLPVACAKTAVPSLAVEMKGMIKVTATGATCMPEAKSVKGKVNLGSGGRRKLAVALLT
jgi:hypothetical protein